MARRLTTALLAVAAIAGAAALTGCGATRAVSNAVDPVARAADVTSSTPGYRMSVAVDGTSAAGTSHGMLSGAIDTAHHTGAFTMHQSAAGHSFTVLERISGLMIYLEVPGQPALQRLTGGKQWIKLDLDRTLGAFGLSGVAGQSSDPSQFIDYLRAVGASPKRIGTETIGGTQTTHYHVVVSLDNYAKLLPPARRAAAARGISTLEATMGTHTMPMDVWIDTHHLVRRMHFSFGECIQSQRITLAMTMNLSDYGPQTVPAPPSPSEAYDLTPLVLQSLKNFKPGTCAASA